MADTMRIPQIKDVENELRIYYGRMKLASDRQVDINA